MSLLDNVVVVLHEPRNGANIGGVVRAMKNFGLSRLRLVRPATFDQALIESLAHRSQELLAASETYGDLDAALADAAFVVGTSARSRELGPEPLTPRALAPQALRRAAQGTVALLFGNEDNGLSNTDLDRCQALVTIPTVAGYSSLNLAQAVMLLVYELHLALPTEPAPLRPADPLPASSSLLAELLALTEQSLGDARFFGHQNSAPTLRRLRLLLGRAKPSEQEARLLLAVLRALAAARSSDTTSGS